MDPGLQEVDWISLMDYAAKYGVSLSTLRRHIKAGKIQHKVENGRYLLRSPSLTTSVNVNSMSATSAVSAPSSETQELRIRLQRAQEEISELKMLVSLYEEQLAQGRPAELRMNVHGHS